jgi:hypothetical protein
MECGCSGGIFCKFAKLRHQTSGHVYVDRDRDLGAHAHENQASWWHGSDDRHAFAFAV